MNWGKKGRGKNALRARLRWALIVLVLSVIAISYQNCVAPNGGVYTGMDADLELTPTHGESRDSIYAFYHYENGVCESALYFETATGEWFYSASCSDYDAVAAVPADQINQASLAQGIVLYEEKIYESRNYPMQAVVCTQAIEYLLNPRTQECVLASNGCRSQALKRLGFESYGYDEELCPQL